MDLPLKLFLVSFMSFCFFALWILFDRHKKRLKKKYIYGIEGSVLYSDDGSSPLLTYELKEHGIEIAGKPDYVIKLPDGKIAILDLKSGVSDKEINPAYKLQLAVYKCLVENHFKSEVTRLAIFFLEDRVCLDVEINEQLEQNLMKELKELRDAKVKDVLPQRTAATLNICKKCKHRNICVEKLT